MAAAPIATAAAAKHATMNARMGFLLFSLVTTRLPGADLFWRTELPPEIRYSDREGKGLRFNFDENSPQRAHARVKVSRFGVFQIDKEAPDPAREMVFKELAIGASRARNIPANQTCHDLTEDSDVILGL